MTTRRSKSTTGTAKKAPAKRATPSTTQRKKATSATTRRAAAKKPAVDSAEPTAEAKPASRRAARKPAAKKTGAKKPAVKTTTKTAAKPAAKRPAAKRTSTTRKPAARKPNAPRRAPSSSPSKKAKALSAPKKIRTAVPRPVALSGTESLRLAARPTGIGRFFGMAPPGTDPSDLTGHLIVLEGTDGSGRSTQITLLREWLELNGYAVVTMGLARSNLVANNIDDLATQNIVTPLTLGLMYAADFYDQIENVMLPSLRAGLVILADRYVYSLIARSVVRGMGREYLEGVYSLGLRPDLVFYLSLPPEVAFEREFKKSQMVSYWESGRDLNLSNDLFESFVLYQTALRRELGGFAREHGFVEVDADTSVATVNKTLRKKIAQYLGIKSTTFKPSGASKDLMK